MPVKAAFIVPHPPLIIPEVGRGEEAKIQATIDAYDEMGARVARLAPDTIIVSSPHATAYQDYFHISPGAGASGDMRRYNAHNSDLACEYDEELAKTIASLAEQEGFPAGIDHERDPKLDHATYIPLFFVNKRCKDYKVVRVGLSGYGPIEHYHLGQLIAEAIDDLGRNAVFIASGDLSHKLTHDGPYGFAEEGPRFDHEVTAAMESGDFMRFLTFEEGFCDNAAECGLRSFQIMAGALDGKKVGAKLHSYEGPFGVGYAVASFYVTGESDERRFAERFQHSEEERIAALRAAEDEYVTLARSSVYHFVTKGEPLPLPEGLPKAMVEQRAGVFVSLHEHGRLRGCIGTISPVCNSIAEEIVRNAISACSEDPRFNPVQEDELAQLEVSVDVLGKTEDIDSINQLDPKRYGVIVTNDMRRGLLLPNLDGVDTVEEQVSIAKRKAGIAEDEPVRLQRFEVVRHEA